MTQTMAKPKVKQTKIELDTTPKLRFKITNTRAQHFPGPLTETDYFGFKVGELVCNSYNSTAIYEIVEISRDILHTTEISNWRSKLLRSTKQPDGTILTVPKDQKAYDLLVKYQESNNFGVCRIKLKTVLRGTNISQKNTYKNIKELDIVKCINYNGIERVDLNNLIQKKTTIVTKLNSQVVKLQTRLSSTKRHMTSLEMVRDKYFPPEAEPVELKDDNGVVVDKLHPSAFI